jgi:hypothetical protein
MLGYGGTVLATVLARGTVVSGGGSEWAGDTATEGVALPVV